MDGYQHKVQYYETDQMGIVHHSNYIRWMEEARVDFLDRIGWDYKKLEESGLFSPVTSVSCRYRRSTGFSDCIRIYVKVEEFKGVKLKLSYKMKNQNDVLVCEASSEHCFQDASGRIVNIKKQCELFYEALMENYSEKE